MCCCTVAKSCLTLCGPTRLFCPWDFPGKNTGMGCHFLLQGIFPTQGSNQRLLHWELDSLPLVPSAKSPNFVYAVVTVAQVYLGSVWASEFAQKASTWCMYSCNHRKAHIGLKLEMLKKVLSKSLNEGLRPSHLCPMESSLPRGMWSTVCFVIAQTFLGNNPSS